MSIFAQASMTSGVGLLELPPIFRRMSKLVDAAAHSLLASRRQAALPPPTREEAMIAAARCAFGWVDPNADEAEF